MCLCDSSASFVCAYCDTSSEREQRCVPQVRMRKPRVKRVLKVRMPQMKAKKGGVLGFNQATYKFVIVHANGRIELAE